MNQQIIDYLNQNKDKFSQEDLIDQLRKTGYQEDDIQNGVNNVYNSDIETDTGKEGNKIKRPIRATVLAVVDGISLLMITVYIIFGSFLSLAMWAGDSPESFSFGLALLFFLGSIAIFILPVYFAFQGTLKGKKWGLLWNGIILIYPIILLSYASIFIAAVAAIIFSIILFFVLRPCWKHPFYNRDNSSNIANKITIIIGIVVLLAEVFIVVGSRIYIKSFKINDFHTEINGMNDFEESSKYKLP